MMEVTDDLKGTEATTTAARKTKEPDPTFGAEDIESILAFHGTPVAAQVLREVLGQLGRAAAAAARRQPRNRAVEDFKAWNPPALRALAELCERYAPEVGTRTSPLDSREMLPDAVDGEIASIEAQVIAERPDLAPPAVVTAEPPVGRAIEVLATVLGAEPLVRDPDPLDEPAGSLVRDPDPEPVHTWAGEPPF
jgi:hypothetical protein